MKKIIVVDDTQAICDTICLIFGQNGYKVESFPTGEALLGKEFDPPEVFILDYQLTGMNGLQLCKLLKAKEGTKGVPVIMISGTPYIAPTLLTGGADFFLEKPFDLADIIKVVEDCNLHNKNTRV